MGFVAVEDASRAVAGGSELGEVAVGLGPGVVVEGAPVARSVAGEHSTVVVEPDHPMMSGGALDGVLLVVEAEPEEVEAPLGVEARLDGSSDPHDSGPTGALRRRLCASDTALPDRRGRRELPARMALAAVSGTT